jgi:hypothetical protein
MADVQTSEMNAKFAPVNVGSCDYEHLYADSSSKDEYLLIPSILFVNPKV